MADTPHDQTEDLEDKKRTAALRRQRRDDIVRTVLLCLGCPCVALGFHLAWEPLGYIVTGLLLIAFALIGHLRSGRRVNPR